MKTLLKNAISLLLVICFFSSTVPSISAAQKTDSFTDETAWQMILDAYNLYFFIGSANTVYPFGTPTVDFAKINTVEKMDEFAKSIYDASISDFFWRTGLRMDCTTFFDCDWSLNASEDYIIIIPYSTPSSASVITNNSEYLFFDINARLQKNAIDDRLPSLKEARFQVIQETASTTEYKFLVWNHSTIVDQLPVPSYIHVVFKLTTSGWRITKSPFAQWMCTTQIYAIKDDSIVSSMLGFYESAYEAAANLFSQYECPYKVSPYFDYENEEIIDNCAIAYLNNTETEKVFCFKINKINQDASESFLGFYDAVFTCVGGIWTITSGGVYELANGNDNAKPIENPYTGDLSIMPLVFIMIASLSAACFIAYRKKHLID